MEDSTHPNLFSSLYPILLFFPFNRWQLHPASCSDPMRVIHPSFFHAPYAIYQEILLALSWKYIYIWPLFTTSTTMALVWGIVLCHLDDCNHLSQASLLLSLPQRSILSKAARVALLWHKAGHAIHQLKTVQWLSSHIEQTARFLEAETTQQSMPCNSLA